jgi:poly-beta-1,6-N-acetyl-D-glucosamine synthase
MNAPNYIVVTPVRNEEQYLPLTIDSMAAQSIRAGRWVLVDDGSTDGTGQIVDAAARKHDWIKAVHRADRGFRQAGGGVIDAFYEGHQLVREEPWDYTVKLDGDLSFSKDYFESCFQHFAAQPRLGIAGGTICTLTDGEPVTESKIDPAFHVRGATKIYRRPCWEAIGGLIRAPGWDCVDEVKANMLGWSTRTLPDLKVVHHRPTGRGYGLWKDWVKSGQADYVAAYHPLFMAVKCLRRLLERPYLLTGCGLFWGYARSYLKRLPRVEDEKFVRYFRGQQINRLLGRTSLWSLAPDARQQTLDRRS